MLDFVQPQARTADIGEQDVLRQIDRAVGRAMFDADYASLLLANPTAILEDRTCPPQHYLSLLGIQASDLEDFARQARALCWPAPSRPLDALSNPRTPVQEEPRRMSIVAAA